VGQGAQRSRTSDGPASRQRHSVSPALRDTTPPPERSVRGDDRAHPRASIDVAKKVARKSNLAAQTASICVRNHLTFDHATEGQDHQSFTTGDSASVPRVIPRLFRILSGRAKCDRPRPQHYGFWRTCLMERSGAIGAAQESGRRRTRARVAGPCPCRADPALRRHPEGLPRGLEEA
jgi:hypothetical protein